MTLDDGNDKKVGLELYPQKTSHKQNHCRNQKAALNEK